MKTIKLIILLIGIIFQYASLNAQKITLNCGNSLEEIINSKILKEGENEICNLSNGTINLVAVVNKGKIISWKAIDESGKSLSFINEINTKASKKSGGTSTNNPKPYSNLICSWVDIICGTYPDGNLKFCKHKICFPCN